MDPKHGNTGQEHNMDPLDDAESELDLLRISGSDDILLEASLAQYQRYLDQLDAARSHLDVLLASTTATLDQLANISASFKTVELQTTAFQTQSAGISEEQRHNQKVFQDINENIQYYEPLERITRRMNAPGAGSFVKTRDFRDMLVTLDECIDYMQRHPDHKEAEMYRARYKQLLTRALTLVRNTFMNGAKDITAKVAKRIADKQLNDTTMSALLYAKFRVDADAMKDLGLEIQKRAAPPADAEPGTEGEYQSLMNELHQSFASCRAKLVLPLIQKRLTDTAAAATSKDLLQFARSAITYVRGICLDEFELWEEWFHGQRGVYDLLEALCEPLYDHLRPRILYENKLSKLCSLVTLLQTRYLNDEEDEAMPDPTQLSFASLIQPALEDAQTRLVFRALAMLRDEIESFKPSSDDLDYPRKNSVAPARQTSVPLSGKRGEVLSPTTTATGAADDDSGDEGALWSRSRMLDYCYPTLSKAIRLLSRIYRLVNSSIFDDLAHQIVHQTTLSLVTASQQISAKASAADGQLFLLRHLLLLKSQIVAFDIEYVTPDVSFDFSGMTNTFFEIRERGGLFNPSSWLRLFSSGGLIPRVIENMLDAKVELDGMLRTVINDFTAGFARDMTSDLKQNVNGGGSGGKKAQEAVVDTRTKIEKEVPILRAKLEQYLDDMRTRETLVAAVEDQVVQSYEAYFEDYAGRGNAVGKLNGTSKISRKGKSPDDGVWDADTFTEWAVGLFNVALPNEVDASPPGSRSLSRSRSS